MAASTSGHAPARSAARARHGALRFGQRGTSGLAEPLGGERILLPRRMERDTPIPVEPVGVGEPAALLSQAARTLAASVRAARSSA